jgi:APA family basic amino acid/polyamine antiporter
VGYLPDVWPALDDSAPLRCVLAVALVWSLCLVNVLGVRHGVRLQVAVLVLGLGPLLITGAAGLAAFDARNLEPFAPQGVAGLPAAMALVVWAYSGVESAAVPAEEVRDPRRTIARATYAGYAIGTALFLLLALAVAGALANERVATSTRPLALLAAETCGRELGLAVSVTAVIACLGTLNGWLLLAGRIPLAAAQDGLFPAALARVHPRYRTPAAGLVVAAAIASATLALLLVQDFLDVFGFVVNLALVLTLVPHLLAAAAEWKFARGAARASAGAAAAFVLFAIAGCGLEALGWSALLAALGWPVYRALRRKRAV